MRAYMQKRCLKSCAAISRCVSGGGGVFAGSHTGYTARRGIMGMHHEFMTMIMIMHHIMYRTIWHPIGL